MSHKEKLEYLYLTPEEIKTWPIYGSLIRALGKSWTINVLCNSTQSTNELTILKNLLHEPDKLNILLPNVSTTPPACDLFLNMSPLVTGTTATHHTMSTHLNEPDSADLISSFRIQELNEKGVTAITGKGKGKTTSALGKVLPQITSNKKVAIIQWFKEFKDGSYTWAINEHSFPKRITDQNLIQFYPTGLGFYGSPNLDRVKGEMAYEKHRQKAYSGLDLAIDLINSQRFSEIVLDELIDTVKEIAQNIEYPLIDLPDLQTFLDFCASQDKTCITVTGRRVTDDWKHFISQSIEIEEVKHPWSSSGQSAISGLDF